MTGRMFDERLGKLHFWLTFVSFNLTFAPMHVIGVQGMPRRVADYPEQFATWNLFISLASFVLGLSTLVFVYNIVRSWRTGAARRGQPVARAHARVAGLLAAADLQLRPRADRRRRAVRVRRARRGPRHLPARRRGGQRHRNRPSRPGTRAGSEWPMAEILVLANETIGGEKLLDAIRERARAGRRALPRRRPADPPAARQRDLRRGGARLGAGPRRPGARVHARRGHRGHAARSATATRSTPPRTRSPSTGSTRSSSRRCPRSPRAG